MTASNSSVNSADFRAPTADPSPQVDPLETHQSSLTVRDRYLRVASGVEKIKNWLMTFLVPPRALMEKPPGWSELTAYVYRGDWTASPRGFLRGCATVWICTFGLAGVVLARTVEWLLTRPSRALAYFITWQLLAHTGPGRWIAGGIEGFAHLLAVIFRI